jgi:hypothetical protein
LPVRSPENATDQPETLGNANASDSGGGSSLPSDGVRSASHASASEGETEAKDAIEASGFDNDMAKIVLERARKQAVQCPSVVKETPTGEGDIEIEFDGKSGRIVNVNLGMVFAAGSTTGQACLKNAFLGQIVTRFEGKKTLSFSLKIAPLDKSAGKKQP